MRIVVRSFAPVAALLALSLAAPAAAQTTIGAIRTQQILRDAPQTKAAQQKMSSEFEKREKDLQGEGKKLEEDIKKFRREQDTMSAQQRADTEKSLNTRKIDFDLKQRQFAEAAQTRNQELQRELFEKVYKAIEEVAKEKNLAVVLQDPAYVAPEHDITQDVLKKLGAAGGTAPAGETKKKK